ncbi:hypothetical protein DXG03_004068 [Asterophora parasitica]|uniref:Protein kinase domain-containing protein n=1 Tax=Asterophora parasitica TaxID=117018 RepID=A0A9P7KBX3_9AGAR|nr:hypothetical protein DXG03_004068 [Asterophora parasitica]
MSNLTNWATCEDAVPLKHPQIMDAICPGGTVVVLKPVDRYFSSTEIEIARDMFSGKLVSEPRNRCVPILEVIQPPTGSNDAFLVMPLLSDAGFTPFETIGELVEFFRQIFKGLQLMHEHHVAHWNCQFTNIMADDHHLYSSPLHPASPNMKRDYSGRAPKPASRTRNPVKYYLVDFSISEVYRPEDWPHLDEPPWGNDRSVPEFHVPNSKKPCSPFPVDVYCMGNFIRQHYLDGRDNLP